MKNNKYCMCFYFICFFLACSSAVLGVSKENDKNIGIIPKEMKDDFLIPDSKHDQYGNSVVIRDGSKLNRKTGYYLELWMKDPSIEFIYIPPGEFAMGSSKQEKYRSKPETPKHSVKISRGFYLAKYEITQKQYKQVLGVNPSFFHSAGEGSPVENVKWEECLKFCKDRRLDLSSEAQWEYACRAGTQSATYNGPIRILGFRNSSEIDAIGWYGGNSGVDYNGGVSSDRWIEKQYDHTSAGTHRVGIKKPNNFGIYDMIGNVYEWCKDKNSKTFYEKPGKICDPICANGDGHVIRGGCWWSLAIECRSASRIWERDNDKSNRTGFRPIKMIEPKE